MPWKNGASYPTRDNAKIYLQSSSSNWVEFFPAQKCLPQRLILELAQPKYTTETFGKAKKALATIFASTKSITKMLFLKWQS